MCFEFFSTIYIVSVVKDTESERVFSDQWSEQWVIFFSVDCFFFLIIKVKYIFLKGGNGHWFIYVSDMLYTMNESAWSLWSYASEKSGGKRLQVYTSIFGKDMQSDPLTPLQDWTGVALASSTG